MKIRKFSLMQMGVIAPGHDGDTDDTDHFLTRHEAEMI